MKCLKRELIKIAHSYGVKCRFPKKLSLPDADVFKNVIRVRCNVSKRLVISEFFHEIGHIIDKREGKYLPYYRAYPTKKYLKRYAVQAELHTDRTGEKLMAKHYPHMKFIHTYKYKVWQKVLKEYWKV